MKAGRYDINEASLGRIYQHVVSNPKVKNWGVISASRGELTPAENAQKTKDLENDLRNLGYGFIHVDGMWLECRKPNTDYEDCPEEMKVPTKEKALFIPNISKEHATKLGNKYGQDSVLFADEENKKNGEATYITKSGEVFNIGRFEPGKISRGYSKIKGGKVFTFEPPKQETPKDEPIKLKSLLPKGIINRMIKNPETGRMIKLKSALRYDKKSPVFKQATDFIKKVKQKN